MIKIIVTSLLLILSFSTVADGGQGQTNKDKQEIIEGSKIHGVRKYMV